MRPIFLLELIPRFAYRRAKSSQVIPHPALAGRNSHQRVHFENNIPPLLSASLVLALAAFAPACGDDEEAHNHDDAHLMFVSAPPTAITVDTAVPVTYMVHTEGDLHHSEIRACMGHSTDCGLNGEGSFDINFPATKDGDTFSASVMLGTAGPWTIAVYAHVGETPHISEVVHATVSE